MSKGRVKGRRKTKVDYSRPGPRRQPRDHANSRAFDGHQDRLDRYIERAAAQTEIFDPDARADEDIDLDELAVIEQKLLGEGRGAKGEERNSEERNGEGGYR